MGFGGYQADFYLTGRSRWLNTGFHCDFISLPRCEDMYRFYSPPGDMIIYRPDLIGSTVAVCLISGAGPGWKPGRMAVVEWTILAATKPCCPATQSSHHWTRPPFASCFTFLSVSFMRKSGGRRGGGVVRKGVACGARRWWLPDRWGLFAWHEVPLEDLTRRPRQLALMSLQWVVEDPLKWQRARRTGRGGCRLPGDACCACDSLVSGAFVTLALWAPLQPWLLRLSSNAERFVYGCYINSCLQTWLCNWQHFLSRN